MLVRTIAMGLAVMATAVSVDAQERGTVEFGVFGSGGSYDDGLGLGSGWGGGGRVGAFLFPRLSVEFEAGGSSAPPTIRTGDNVSVGVLSGRLTAVPIKAGRLSLLAGLGVNHTDASFLESYGVHGTARREARDHRARGASPRRHSHPDVQRRRLEQRAPSRHEPVPPSGEHHDGGDAYGRDRGAPARHDGGDHPLPERARSAE